MLHDLIQTLTLQKDDGPITAVRLVKGYDNSYALNAAGQITALSIGNSKLKKLVLGKDAEALEYLYLSGSKSLTEIIFEVLLPHLTHLYLNNCAIQEITIPKGFRSLQQVYLQKNSLTKLVFEGDCPALVLLDVSENQLDEFYLPFAFEKLSYLYLLGKHNGIGNIPREVIGENPNCSERVKAFFRASLQSGDILNNEAKCIFFGNGRAGKTTLSHQLRKNEFDPTIQSTHGILIEGWEIQKQDFSKELNEKIEKEKAAYLERRGRHLHDLDNVQLNVWDFGGQEYFHATHRLFLNNNVLYLLVWEKATDAQNETANDYPKSYWQKNINHYAPENITLTIQNKEQGSADINHDKGNYKIAFRVAQKPHSYEMDVETLKGAIIQKLPNLSYLAVPIPKLYDDIRQEIRRVKAAKPYLFFEEYQQLCQRIDRTPDQIMQKNSDLEALTTFLHDTGAIICYRKTDTKDNPLDNYVFIDPQWVTKTIYQILDETILQGNGEFDRQHVERVLSDTKNIIPNASVWLSLMTEFELIFQKKDTEDQFITPQYLPAVCTDLSEKAWRNLVQELPHRLVLYYPQFLPKSVISRFICRYGNLAQDFYWKYGIIFHDEQTKEKASVSCDYAQRTITIQTSKHLSPVARKLLESFQNIDPTESLEIAVSSITTPAELTPFVNYQKLKERADKHKTDVEWNGQDIDIQLFAPLLEREERGLGHKIPAKILINNAEPYVVTMAPEARFFLPFSELQEKIKILFLASGTLNTGLEGRFKDIIKLWAEEGRFDNVKDEHGLDKDKFKGFLLKENPHIFHYGGHGHKEGIVLENGELKAEILKRYLKLSTNIQCVILNACNSFEIAKIIAEYVPYVIATQDKINDTTAIAFSKGFYLAIAANKTIEEAFEFGLIEIEDEQLSGKEVFILVKGIK